MTRAVRVYRLAVTHPEGSHDAQGWPVPGWEPPGWDALADKYNRFAGGDFGSPLEVAPFAWPTERAFLSRSGAEYRATMLRDFGATVEIEPSDPVTWPTADGAS